MKINTLVFLFLTIIFSSSIFYLNLDNNNTEHLSPQIEPSNHQSEGEKQIACIDGEELSASSNMVKGTIDVPSQGNSFIQKGTSYQEKSSLSAEKKQINLSNAPEKNIYISLHPLDFTPELSPTPDAVMTQREKTFFPNIVAVTKGSTVKFMNEDEHYHNVFSLTPKSRFNIGRRPTGNVYGQKIKKVGVIKLGCDIHDEMSGVILSLNTPYFTKIKENGTYEISELPDGRYRLQVYHPSIRKHTEEITVSGNQTLTKNIKLSSKA